jgi:hypothetical protein
VVRGFRYLNAHVHPTLEGASEMWEGGNPNRHVFGSTFNPYWCGWSLHWGLFAAMILLWEVGRFAPKGETWNAELNEFSDAAGRWGLSHLARFDDSSSVAGRDDLEESS